ncbi:hypothetical protein ABZS66_19145 [Dactylosporangium sp. NPDC005572]|uniref:hypothetical protein n=1 Tax=Dactylosporangium sp. NPDC005572 TaxID=3156889 RepID=UPI0033B47244
MPDLRPTCPTCGADVDRLQPSPDVGQGSQANVIAIYPCGCWLSPADARALVAAHRRSRTP